MFGLSFGEILIILVVALLVLGPTGMPKLARTLGKGLRDFRRATSDIRGAFEEEFYKLDQEVEKTAASVSADPAAGLDRAHAPPAVPAPEGTLPRPATPLPADPMAAAHGHAVPEGTAPAAPNVVSALPGTVATNVATAVPGAVTATPVPGTVATAVPSAGAVPAPAAGAGGAPSTSEPSAADATASGAKVDPER